MLLIRKEGVERWWQFTFQTLQTIYSLEIFVWSNLLWVSHFQDQLHQLDKCVLEVSLPTHRLSQLHGYKCTQCYLSKNKGHNSKETDALKLSGCITACCIFSLRKCNSKIITKITNTQKETNYISVNGQPPLQYGLSLQGNNWSFLMAYLELFTGYGVNYVFGLHLPIFLLCRWEEHSPVLSPHHCTLPVHTLWPARRAQNISSSFLPFLFTCEADRQRMVCVDWNVCFTKADNSVQGMFLSMPGILTAGLSHTRPLATGFSLFGQSN